MAIATPRVPLVLLFFAAATAVTAGSFPYAEGSIIEPSSVPGLSSNARLQGIQVAIVGNGANITHGVVLLHGDGPSYYLLSTLGTRTNPTEDRRKLEADLGAGEGMVVLFPRSQPGIWPGFPYDGSNGDAIYAIFRYLIDRTCNPRLTCHLGGMSGGSLPLNAFLHFINGRYGTDGPVTSFVDGNLATVTDHDALCRPIAMQRRGYITAAKRHSHVRFNFIHGHGGTMTYVRGHHQTVGREASGDATFELPYRCPSILTLKGGQLRFWSAPSHWLCFKGQIHESIFGGNRPTAIASTSPSSGGNSGVGPSSTAIGLLGQQSGPVATPPLPPYTPGTKTPSDGTVSLPPGAIIIDTTGSGRLGWTVQPGYSLTAVAVVLLGSPYRWIEIYVVNPGMITNPNTLDPIAGQTIWLPPPTVPTTPPTGPGTIPEVVATQPPTDGSATETMPLRSGTVTSNFGPRWGRHHDGIDIGAPLDTPIYAPGDGVVVSAGWCGGYGNLVKVRHTDGTLTYYAHCRDFSVEKGQTVKAGQQIASINSTGSSTGNHLHFGVMTSDGRWVDPRSRLPFPEKGSSLPTSTTAD